MRILMMGIRLSLFAAFAVSASGAAVPDVPEIVDSQRADFVISVDAEGRHIAAMRLEIFDAASGESIFDTGVEEGTSLLVPSKLKGVESRSTYELRAWDRGGELVMSQAGRLSSEGSDEIFSISFDVVPAGTAFVTGGAPITLDSDVEVTGSLSTTALQKPGGAAFFGTCTAGTSIREILPDGAVTCEVDDVGSGGDDLGNHQASQTLVMGNHWTQFNAGFGLRSSVGAEVKTGPEGRTFLFQPAANFPSSETDIAQFHDQNGVPTIGVPQEGSFKFVRGHKVCRALDVGTNRSDSIIASASWTANSCSGFANSVGLNSFQLVCVHENGFSFGAVNSQAPPAVNCGW